MPIFLVSPQDDWRAWLNEDLGRALPNDRTIEVALRNLHGRFSGDIFDEMLRSLAVKIVRELRALDPIDESVIGLFDLGGFKNVEGSLFALDHAGGANLFACLALRFPTVDWILCHPSPGFLGEHPDLPRASSIDSLTEVSPTVAARSAARLSARFDADGLRAILKRRVIEGLFPTLRPTAIPGVRYGACVVMDDEERHANSVALCAYLAGYRVEVVASTEMFQRTLVDAPSIRSYELAIEPMALSLSDDSGTGYQLSFEARRNISPVLRGVSNVFIYSSNVTSPIDSTKNIAMRSGPPAQSIWDLVEQVKAAGPKYSFIWPVPTHAEMISEQPHALPRRASWIVDGLLQDSKFFRTRSAIYSAITAIEALELSASRGPLAVAATIEKHAALLQFELENPAEFLASDVKRRTALTMLDLLASTTPQSPHDTARRRRLMVDFGDRALGAQLDLYRSRYHFAEEMHLLRLMRALHTHAWSPFQVANLASKSIPAFCASVGGFIVLFALLDIWLGRSVRYCHPLDLLDLWKMIQYSAVGFASIQQGPDDWARSACVRIGSDLGWLAFIQIVIAAAHWGLGLMQAFLWFSRR